MANGQLRLCGNIHAKELKQLKRKGFRPGAKMVLFQRDTLDVLLGKLPDGYDEKRLNFPGGGIDEWESAATALLREGKEEVTGLTLSIQAAVNAPVLAEGPLAISRDGFNSKYEFLVGIQVADLTKIKAKPGSKLTLFPPMLWVDALIIVEEDMHIGEDMRILYSNAFKEIPHLAA